MSINRRLIFQLPILFSLAFSNISPALAAPPVPNPTRAAPTLLKRGKDIVRLYMEAVRSSMRIARGKPTTLVKSEVIDCATTNCASQATMQAIKNFKTQLETKTNGALIDVTEKIKTGHYYQNSKLLFEDEAWKAEQAFNNTYTEGMFVLGDNGTGKSQIAYILQENLPNTRVIVVSRTNSPANLDEFKTQMQALKSHLDNEGSGNSQILIWFEDGSFLTKDSAKSSIGGQLQLEGIVGVTKETFGNGRTKIAIESSSTVQEAIGLASPSIASKLKHVQVNKLDKFRIDTVVKDLRARYKEEFNIDFTDETAEKLVEWCESFYAAPFPESIVRAMAGTTAYMESLLKKSVSPASAQLRASREKLTMQLEAYQKSKGAHARIRRRQIPKEINDLNVEIERIDGRFAELQQTKEEIAQLKKDIAMGKTDGLTPEEIKKSTELNNRLVELEEKARQIRPEDLAHYISEDTGTSLDDILVLREYATFSDKLAAYKDVIFGIDEIVEDFVKAIQRPAGGMYAGDGPLTAMFIGPSGTGKTWLAKVAARIEKLHFEEMNMAKYAQKHAAEAEMSGSPTGFVGNEKGSFLTRLAKKAKRFLLLMDEFDQSDEAMQAQLFMPFDTGKVSDLAGGTGDISEAVIVATTNIAADLLKPGMSRMEIIKILFSTGRFPNIAFLNRIKKFYIFPEVSRESWARMLLAELKKFNRGNIKDNVSGLEDSMGQSLVISKRAMSGLLKNMEGRGETARDVKKLFSEEIRDRYNLIARDKAYSPRDGVTVEIEFLHGDMIIFDFDETVGFFFRIGKRDP